MELSSVKSDTVSLLSITSETSSLSKHTMNGDNGSFAKTLTRAKKKQFHQLPMLTRRRKMAPFFLLVGEVVATCRLLFDIVEGTFARLY